MWCVIAGILLVVAIGVALGVFLGGLLLTCCHHRIRRCVRQEYMRYKAIVGCGQNTHQNYHSTRTVSTHTTALYHQSLGLFSFDVFWMTMHLKVTVDDVITVIQCWFKAATVGDDSVC